MSTDAVPNPRYLTDKQIQVAWCRGYNSDKLWGADRAVANAAADRAAKVARAEAIKAAAGLVESHEELLNQLASEFPDTMGWRKRMREAATEARDTWAKFLEGKDG